MSKIRREQPQDIPEIREVNIRAFGQEQEASVVDKLRENCNSVLSLVAFMILILDRKAMNGITGVAGYREEWAEAM